MSTWATGIQSGLRSAQPTPSLKAAGTLYKVTDEDLIERWSGTAWEAWSVTGDPAPLPSDSVIYDGGNITMNATGWTDLHASAFDATVPAQVGDVLALNFGGLVANVALATYFDIALVTRGGTATDNNLGWGGWACTSSAINNVSGALLYTVVAGDIDGNGDVLCRPQYKQSGAGNRTFFCAAPGYSATFGVVNLSGLRGPTGATGASGPAPTARQRYTGGHITLTNTSWAAVTGPSDLVIAAVAGDVIECSVSGFMNNSAAEMYVDMATVVSGSPVNYVSLGAGGASNRGVMAWGAVASLYGRPGGSIQYVVQAGDISGGNVTLRLYNRCASGTGKQWYATSDIPLHYSVVNFGQVV